MLTTQGSASSPCAYIPQGFTVYAVTSGSHVSTSVVKKPWFMAAIPPLQHRATRLGVINRDAIRCCTDKDWLTPLWPHTLAIHWLLGTDEVINDLFLPVSEGNTDAAFKDSPMHRGLPKLSGPNIILVKLQAKKQIVLKLKQHLEHFLRRVFYVTPLFASWCVCVFVWTCTHLNLPSLWLICAQSSWTQGTYPLVAKRWRRRLWRTTLTTGVCC